MNHWEIRVFREYSTTMLLHWLNKCCGNVNSKEWVMEFRYQLFHFSPLIISFISNQPLLLWTGCKPGHYLNTAVYLTLLLCLFILHRLCIHSGFLSPFALLLMLTCFDCCTPPRTILSIYVEACSHLTPAQASVTALLSLVKWPTLHAHFILIPSKISQFRLFI